MSKNIAWCILIALWVGSCAVLQEAAFLPIIMVILLLILYRIYREANPKLANILIKAVIAVALLPVIILIQVGLKQV